MARARWSKAISNVEHRRFVFLDESCAKTNMTRLYGRAPRGQRVYERVPNGRWETTTMIAAIGRNGAQAPWLLDGSMDGDSFAVWVAQVLGPTLTKGDIVVMDNLSVHKNEQARAAIAAKGAEIWDLPPYSPDFNPIEKMWSKVKAYLRKAKPRDADALCNAVAQAFERITAQDTRNWFTSCGYSLI